MPAPSGPPLLLFDGVCNLCNASVAWILERDRRGRFRFASLQSDAARAALAAAGAGAPEALPDSMVLIDATGVHTQSDAVLGVGRHLGFPWSLARLGVAIPRPLRDALYAFVARGRYRWFGKRDTCMVPKPELAARFLDAGERRDGQAEANERKALP